MRPRWYRFAWFLGKAPQLTQRQWTVLGMVSIVSFFNSYDAFLFNLNLKQIQASLGVAEGDVGSLGAVVRAGALLSVFVLMAADRLGRKRVLMFTVLAYTLATGATALAPDARTFVALQFFARVFSVAEALLATVVIVEEFPADQRGWGVGAAGAIQACGAGIAAIMFGFVSYLPFGWRALYAVGVLPLLMIAWWRRLLPEAERFIAVSQRRFISGRVETVLTQLSELVTTHQRQFLPLILTAFILSFGFSGAAFFQAKYLQDVQHWSTGAVAILTFVGGGLAIVGNPYSGRLSDRFGRRKMIAWFTFAGIVGATLFYSSAGFAIPVLWVAWLFADFGSDTTLGTYAAEVFPTSLRSTAVGVRQVISSAGAVLGLLAVSGLYRVFDSNWSAIRTLLAVCLLAPLVVLLLFRETARKTLEELAPEAPVPAAPLTPR